MLSRMRIRHLLLAAVSLCIVACGDSRDLDPNLQTLDRGINADPESVDPHKGRSVQAAEIVRDIGEGLMGYSASGELIPAAAESWNVSDDGLIYTFTLRENARWSTGEPLRADDFVFSFRRLVDPATAAFYANVLTDVDNADAIAAGEAAPAALAVRAIDARTLEIGLTHPTPYILSLFTAAPTFPVHRGSIAEHGDDFTRPGKLVSNGPYVLQDWERGSVLVLQRNPHYWNNDKTAIDVVNYHVLPQEMSELNRFRAGEIQITSSVPPDNFAQIREEYPEQLHVAPYLGVYYYGFNLTKPPFQNNPQLRQALSMAIDRETLVDKIVGRGEAPAYGWVPPGVDNYESPQFSYAELSQPERNSIAQQLLREAGYGDGKPLDVEIRYNTNDTHKRIALAVQSMWLEVLGFEATLVNEDLQVLLANMRAAEVTEVFRSSWIGDYNDAHTFLSILQGSNASNMPRYANEEYDGLMDKAATQLDSFARRVHLEEAERVMLSEHPVIPLYFYVSKHLVSPEVRGWQDNVLDYHYSHHLSLATD